MLMCGFCLAQNGGLQPVTPEPVAMETDSLLGITDDDYAELVDETATETTGSKSMVVSRDNTRVAVLGYHNFSETEPVTDMLMRTSEFRDQMEYIRQSGLTVISMQEFLEWRFGVRDLPEKCVLITMDDGWDNVYKEAFPVLKEYGYPFHLFLYTDFLSGRGDSMSAEQIREMMQHGASIGSHSVSHPYPSDWKLAEESGEEVLREMVDKEIGGSIQKLIKLFGGINTYCYPGGYTNRCMLDNLPRYGCVAAFTVVPGKVTTSSNPLEINRYMIFGNNPNIFRNAMDFRVAQLGTVVTTGASPGTLPATTPPPPFAVSPRPKEIVSCDVPAIVANMADVAGVNFSTVRMKVSGFGRVPAKVDEASRTVQWVPPCRIYMPHISVHVTWKSTDGTSHKAEWFFGVDPNVPAQP